MENFKEKISKIKAFAFDCDGVLTDGSIMVLENGEMLRKFDSKDGFAIARALKYGYPVAIISGGYGVAMTKRFENLGVQNIYTSVRNKIESLADFCEKNSIDEQDVLYVGDDIPDICVMKRVGLAVAPSDAVLDVKAVAHHVSAYGGGKGCVRDVVEQVLKARGDWKWE